MKAFNCKEENLARLLNSLDEGQIPKQGDEDPQQELGREAHKDSGEVGSGMALAGGGGGVLEEEERAKLLVREEEEKRKRKRSETASGGMK